MANQRLRGVLKNVFQLIQNLRIYLFQLIFRLFKLRECIVFNHFQGKGLGDDPKYILLEILNKPEHPQLVWLVSTNDIVVPEGVKKVKIDSIESIFYITTAKVWVNNERTVFYRYKKRKGQFYIQTWHATLWLKKVEDEANLLPEQVNNSKIDAQLTDLMYTNSNFVYEIYRNHFWYNGKILKTDVPRVSVYYKQPIELRKRVLKYFKLDSKLRLVLYAPTFRNTFNKNIYMLDFQKIKETLDTKLNTKCVILVRLHPGITKYADNLIKYSDDIINASSYPDMAELICVSDILITDFSSCMFDFGILRKPCFLIAKDYDEYIKKERGLLFDLKDLPFKLSLTEEELIERIKLFDHDLYNSNCNQFYNNIGFYDSGNGSRIIAELIINKVYNGTK